MTKTQSKLQLDTLFTWATLVVILIYLTVFFLIKPYIGFGYTSEGVINEIFNKDKESCSPELTKDDQIETFQGVAWEKFSEKSFQGILQDVETGSTISLTLLGRDELVSCRVLAWESQEFIQRVNSLWWLALVFWLAGAMSVWFVRPKDGLRRALIAVSFFTAIWIAAGHASPTGLVYSRSILRAILWLSVAAFVDFHWRFPRPVYPLPTIVSGLWYGAAGVLAVGEWFGWRLIGDSEAILGGCFAVVFGLIVIRFVTQPQERSALSPLMGAFVVCVVPVMIILVVDVAGWALPSLAQGMALLGLPAVPGAYFWAVYRYQIRSWTKQITRLFRFYFGLLIALVLVAVVVGWWGAQGGLEKSRLFIGGFLITLELGIALTGFLPLLSVAVIAQNDESMLRPGITFRVNRQATNAIFFVLVLTLIAIPLTLWLLSFNQNPLSKLAVIIGVTLTFWVVAIYRTRFNRWIESRLLGIPVPPAGLLEIYSAHLPTILTHAELSDYLTRRILPSILVRQSALYYLDEMSHPILLYQHRLQPTELLNPAIGLYLIMQPEQIAITPNLSWVRVALPLRLGNKVSGLWLFGRRDPDDRYAQTELPFFQALANHTAIALESITQANRLRAIYQANINQQDAERGRLSRELHDQVLNELATIILNLDDRSYTPQFEATYQLVSTKLRQVVHDLRPAALDYGLYQAFEQLADDLNERTNNQPEIVVTLPAGDTRYPLEVEQHLFYIVQEACRNAIRHANASHIEISGSLQPDLISLQVKDTGRGIPHPISDLANLLTNKHYGLVGMYERANIINATFGIESLPGQGTTIHLAWQAKQTGQPSVPNP